MSVHNGDAYVRDAIGSVLSQTSRDFEFIIIDDGSTDSTFSIINKYHDPRILLIRNEKNIGLTKSLNKGLAVARGEYIARIDSDDIAYPERLAKQYHMLKKVNGDICFCGADIEDPDLNYKKIWRPRPWLLTRWRGLFGNSYGFHSAVMFDRKKILNIGGYDETFQFAQDYELWDRCVQADMTFCYVETSELHYRFCEEGISRLKLDIQQQYANQISHRAIRRYMPRLNSSTPAHIRVFFCRNHSVRNHPFLTPSLLNEYTQLVASFCKQNSCLKDRRLVWQDFARSISHCYHISSQKTKFMLFIKLLQIALHGGISLNAIFRKLNHISIRRL